MSKIPFDYSLTRRGSTLYFRVKEQSPALYNQVFLMEVNTHIHSLGIKLHVDSCDYPELCTNTIFLRGGDITADDLSSASTFSSVAIAKHKQTAYKTALEEVKKFLASYEDDSVLRKIKSLETRFLNKTLPKVMSQPLPLPA